MDDETFEPPNGGTWELDVTHNARTIDGSMVVEGAQVMVGDTVAPGEAPAVIAYEVLCRRHHRGRITRAVAMAFQAEPLPFERGDDLDQP